MTNPDSGRAAPLVCVAALLLASCAALEPSVPSTGPESFDRLHAPAGAGASIVLGALPVEAAPPGLDPKLAQLLGRWEGYGHYPPVDKDRKLVVVVQSLRATGGSGYFWSGTNLQYPDLGGDAGFTVTDGGRIEWRFVMPDGRPQVASFALGGDGKSLEGSFNDLSGVTRYGPFVLTRERSFLVYKDYPRYLEGLGIRFAPHSDRGLTKYGSGCLVYLPDGYADSNRAWPLVLFFHGVGDRGDNPYLLAKASPFMYVREKGSLPFVIVAPLLGSSRDFDVFPDAYLEGVLREALSDYRVDPRRVSLTGLSLGGEACWRLALEEPGRFSAVALLSTRCRTFPAEGVARLTDTPFLVVHGRNDQVIPLAAGRLSADALTQAGGRVELRILDSDHDTWTATYSDPSFYAWLESAPDAAVPLRGE